MPWLVPAAVGSVSSRSSSRATSRDASWTASASTAHPHRSPARVRSTSLIVLYRPTGDASRKATATSGRRQSCDDNPRPRRSLLWIRARWLDRKPAKAKSRRGSWIGRYVHGQTGFGRPTLKRGGVSVEVRSYRARRGFVQLRVAADETLAYARLSRLNARTLGGRELVGPLRCLCSVNALDAHRHRADRGHLMCQCRRARAFQRGVRGQIGRLD